MIIRAEAIPGPLDSVLEDAYNLATKTGATIRFEFNNETVELADFRNGGASALFYKHDSTFDGTVRALWPARVG